MKLRDFLFEIEQTKASKQELKDLIDKKLDCEVFHSYVKNKFGNGMGNLYGDANGGVEVASRLDILSNQFHELTKNTDNIKEFLKKVALQSEAQNMRDKIAKQQNDIEWLRTEVTKNSAKIRINNENSENQIKLLQSKVDFQENQNYVQDQINTKVDQKILDIKRSMQSMQKQFQSDLTKLNVEYPKRSDSYSNLKQSEPLVDKSMRRRKSIEMVPPQGPKVFKRQVTNNNSRVIGGLERKDILILQKKFDEQIDIVRKKIIDSKTALDDKIEWLYKDHRKLATELKLDLSHSVQIEKDLMKETAKQNRILTEKIEHHQDMLRDLQERYIDVEAKTQSEYLNQQARKQIRNTVEDFLGEFKLKTNIDISSLRKNIMDLQGQQASIKDNQLKFKHELGVLKTQAIFEIQNKNEEITSYIREMTRIRNIDRNGEKKFFTARIQNLTCDNDELTESKLMGDGEQQMSRSIVSPDISITNTTRGMRLKDSSSTSMRNSTFITQQNQHQIKNGQYLNISSTLSKKLLNKSDLNKTSNRGFLNKSIDFSSPRYVSNNNTISMNSGVIDEEQQSLSNSKDNLKAKLQRGSILRQSHQQNDNQASSSLAATKMLSLTINNIHHHSKNQSSLSNQGIGMGWGSTKHQRQLQIDDKKVISNNAAVVSGYSNQLVISPMQERVKTSRIMFGRDRSNRNSVIKQ
eukprot:403354212